MRIAYEIYIENVFFGLIDSFLQSVNSLMFFSLSEFSKIK